MAGCITTSQNISIHAPAKGATPFSMIFVFPGVFQSTLPRRERRLFAISTKDHDEFQSTLPRRERQCNNVNVYGNIPFQSTLPRRERLWTKKNWTADDKISIHAPAKGATEAGAASKNAAIFQSTLPRRERRLRRKNRQGDHDISIHAPAKGATVFSNNYLTFFCNFNPRSREGSDDAIYF